LPEAEAGDVDLDDTGLLVASLRDAGEIARKFFGGTYRQWDKGRGNPVTEADLAIDRQLRRVLLGARPDYGWLSEETEDDPKRLGCARVFVVDPIDGTHGFIKGRPHFTIVGTVVTEGRPVAAAIYNPVTDDMYEASRGAGARRNGAPIRVSARSTLEEANLLGPRDTADDPQWRDRLPVSTKVENRASIAYRLALVAEGAFDAMVSLTAKYEWDVAAGDLIVNEAGGRVTTPDGVVLRYNKPKPLLHGVVAAGPTLHKELVRRLESERPRTRPA
jgi:myo-inositol-1(or 4)-monophosphatase